MPKSPPLEEFTGAAACLYSNSRNFIERISIERKHLLKTGSTVKTLTAALIALPLVALFSYAPIQQEGLSGTGLYADLLPTLVANLGGDELDEPPEPTDKIAAAARAASSPAPGAAALSIYGHSRFVHDPPRSGLARAPPAG